MRRATLVAALVAPLLLGCGSSVPTGSPRGENCPTSAPAALVGHELFDVRLVTTKGTITMRLAADSSPIAVANFVALVSCGFYDDVIFHRIAYMGDGTPFVIQGGDPLGNGTGGPGYTIDDEPVVGSYRRGTLAMARTSAPNSQGSQFFIVLDDAAGPVLEQARTYAILGEVVEGMDVVDAIAAVERNDNDQPIDPITITSATATPVAP